MDKRKLHHIWVKLRPIRHWYIGIVCLFSIGITVFALRQNNLEMIRLREAVIAADEAGSGVEDALQALRSHVHSHMNTNLTSGSSAIRPPIQLTNSYERLVSAEREKAGTINKKVTDDAEVLCEGRFPAGQIQARAQCVQEYITQHGVAAKPIPKELYQFDFVSPRWSPDLAGFSMLISAFLLFVFVLRYSLERWLRHQLT